MKQTKLREPILFTILWIMSVVLFILWLIYWPFGLDIFWYMLWTIVILLSIIIIIYVFLWRIFVLTKRFDRHDTRDVEKYIIGKIDVIKNDIKYLQQEKNDLEKLIAKKL